MHDDVYKVSKLHAHTINHSTFHNKLVVKAFSNYLKELGQPKLELRFQLSIELRSALWLLLQFLHFLHNLLLLLRFYGHY